MGLKPTFKPGLKIDTPIQFLKGVGPKLGDILSKKDIKNVQDLIEYYPRAYEDRRWAHRKRADRRRPRRRRRKRVVGDDG